MDVHPGLASRFVDRFSSPISFRDSVPDGQPIERSQLERDQSISLVEVSEGPDAPPLVSVPSSNFPERSGLWIIEEPEQERTLHHILDVVLISPVLLNAPKSWRFRQEGFPPFGAIMKDREFLAALEQQHIQEQLRTGIRMRVRLEIKEVWQNNEWTVRRKGRSVTQVISPQVD